MRKIIFVLLTFLIVLSSCMSDTSEVVSSEEQSATSIAEGLQSSSEESQLQSSSEMQKSSPVEEVPSEDEVYSLIEGEYFAGTEQGRQNAYKLSEDYIFDMSGEWIDGFFYFMAASGQAEQGNDSEAMYLYRIAATELFRHEDNRQENLRKIYEYINDSAYGFDIEYDEVENRWFSKEFLYDCVREMYSLNREYSDSIEWWDYYYLSIETQMDISEKLKNGDELSDYETDLLDNLGDFNGDGQEDMVFIANEGTGRYDYVSLIDENYDIKPLFMGESREWFKLLKWNDTMYICGINNSDAYGGLGYDWNIYRFDADWNLHSITLTFDDLNVVKVLEHRLYDTVDIPETAFDEMVMQGYEAVECRREKKQYNTPQETVGDILRGNIFQSSFTADIDNDGEEEYITKYSCLDDSWSHYYPWRNTAHIYEYENASSSVDLETYINSDYVYEGAPDKDDIFYGEPNSSKYSQFWTYTYDGTTYMLTLESKDISHFLSIYLNEDGKINELTKILLIEDYEKINIEFDSISVQRY